MRSSETDSAENPYAELGPSAFWRSAIADVNPFSIRNVWKPKFAITPSDRVSTAGSCFAQHIGRSLVERGFRWFNAEPPPEGLSPAGCVRFNYGIFSFRTSNIYTTALLRQWFEWAFEEAKPPEEYWRHDDRYFDPFRPTIEPDGFASADELFASRASTLAAIRRAMAKSAVFVFTMGLTEAWSNRGGWIYPNCPGTLAGEFSSSDHVFCNFGFNDVIGDLDRAISLARGYNADLKLLLTVSPVPLTATASGEHVLVATNYSKSVLRAVAGTYIAGRTDTDYFPSYELVTGVPFRGAFFEPNLRNVAAQGVKFVMDTFFDCLVAKNETVAGAAPQASSLPDDDDEYDAEEDQDDLVCEEMVLEEYNRA